MKSTVFTTFLEMVRSRFSPAIADRMIKEGEVLPGDSSTFLILSERR